MESETGSGRAEQDLVHVPGRGHYDATYISGGREFSLAHQLSAIHRLGPKSVIEIGPGPGLATHCMRTGGIEVTTVDVQADLSPDVVASVLELPFDDAAYDAALCCQVLEHLPFESFGSAITELGRTVKSGIVLSLPDVTRCVYLGWGLRRTGLRARHVGVPGKRAKPFPESRLESMGHYWEIGYQGSELGAVTGAIAAAGLRVESTWRVPELPWHRFFEIRH